MILEQYWVFLHWHTIQGDNVNRQILSVLNMTLTTLENCLDWKKLYSNKFNWFNYQIKKGRWQMLLKIHDWNLSLKWTHAICLIMVWSLNLSLKRILSYEIKKKNIVKCLIEEKIIRRCRFLLFCTLLCMAQKTS